MTELESREEKSAKQLEKEFKKSLKEAAEDQVLKSEEAIRDYVERIRGRS